MSSNSQTTNKENKGKNESQSVGASQTQVSEEPKCVTGAELIQEEEVKESMEVKEPMNTPRPSSSKRARSAENGNGLRSQESSVLRFQKSCAK